jgi:hypothetical protein
VRLAEILGGHFFSVVFWICRGNPFLATLQEQFKNCL